MEHDDDATMMAGVVDISLVKIPFRGDVNRWELRLSNSDLPRSVSWLKRQCADREQVQEDCVVVFNISDSADTDSILSSEFLNGVPDNIDELQIVDPDRVENLLPGAVWLANPFETLKTFHCSKLRLLALIAQKPEDLPTIQDLPPMCNDIRVTPSYVQVLHDIDHLAISTLESPLPANHVSHAAEVFGLLNDDQEVQTPTTQDLVDYQQSSVAPGLMAITELSSILLDQNEKLPVPSDSIEALEANTADYLESQLPDGHQAFTAKILQLQDFDSDQALQPRSKLIGLPLVPTYLIPRDDDMKAVMTELATKRAVCIVGELGVGKTLLATQFVMKHQDEYDWVFFVSCATEQSLMDGFRTLVNATSLHDGALKYDGEVIEACLGWLKTHKNYLIILDNADNLGLLKSTIGKDEFRLEGRAIITSRNAYISEWVSQELLGDDKTVSTLNLKLWTRLETVSFLKQRVPFLDNILKRDGEQDHLNDICENYLTDYPIIIEQFATLLIESGRFTSLKFILQRLNSSGWDKLLGSAGEGRLESFSDLFKRALESLVAVKNIGPLSVFLVCIIGTFGSSPLPMSVVKESFNLLKPKLPETYRHCTFEECLHSLRSSAFLKTTDNDSENITTHNVFHKLSIEVGWAVLEEKCATMLREVRFRKYDLVDICWAASATLIPATTCYSEYYFSSEVQDACTSMTAHLLHLSQSESQAVPYVACLERVGWVHFTSSIRIPNAKPVFERALELRILESGGSRETLACANVIEALATLLISLGDFKRSEELMTEVFETKVKICGTREAEPIISVYEKLAHSKRIQKDYTAGIAICREALDVIRKVRGDLRNDAAQYLQMVMGEMLTFQHKLDGVLEIFEEALETCRYLNDRHSAINVLFSIAKLHFKAQRYERSIDVYQEVYDTSSKLYDSNKHLVPATALLGIAYCYQNLGAYQKALALLEAHLETLIACYGTLNTERAAGTITTIGFCWFYMGQYDTAIEKIQLARKLFVEMGLPKSSDVVIAKIKESRVQAAKGNLKTALVLVDEAMTTSGETLDVKDNENYLDGLHYRGHFKRLLGDFEGATEDLQLCLKNRIAFYKSKENPSVAATIVEMGCVLRDEGKLDEALEMIQEGMNIQLQTHPHKETMQNVENIFELALVFKKLGNLDDARLRLEESLELLYTIFGRDFDHPKMAEIKKELESLVTVQNQATVAPPPSYLR
ncbi:hypothetical protein HDV05_003476 [Chytridiales sp. JEL 0842]|nr:hypothetical protein HDV05_003476 [Chytridiales sp. JEL 0842]